MDCVLQVQRNSERHQGKNNKLFLWVNLCTGYCDNNITLPKKDEKLSGHSFSAIPIFYNFRNVYDYIFILSFEHRDANFF